MYHNVLYYLLQDFALLCNKSQNTPLEPLSLLYLQSLAQQFSFQKSLKHQESMNLDQQHHIKMITIASFCGTNDIEEH
jgi:hypothetical protein